MMNPINSLGKHTCKALLAGANCAARHSVVTGSAVTLVALAAIATAISYRNSIWGGMHAAGRGVRDGAIRSKNFIVAHKTGFGIGAIVTIAAFVIGKRL